MANHLHKTYPVNNPAVIKAKVLNWLRQFNTFCFLNSNHYEHREKCHEILVGAGVVRKFESSAPDAIERLQLFMAEQSSWFFGHFGYELQTHEHVVMDVKDDALQFPNLCFFEPEIVLHLKNNEIQILAHDPEQVLKQIENTNIPENYASTVITGVQEKISKGEYLDIIKKLQYHIHRGDCYELNFCQEFFAEKVNIDPFELYNNLNRESPNPFSGFYRLNEKWLVCASPERFLQKHGRRLISQPIKGTLKRSLRDGDDSGYEQLLLRASAKDKAENVMVVDLVRNDLSRVCKEGTVAVDELFGIYSFPQVHQMISTVSGELRDDAGFAEIIHATFPMGSMTGAPKIKVMELINRYEKSKRGIFSGALGYLNPQEDFDFNVVIRSLMYNDQSKYLSFQAGSGITAYSDAEKEWEECMIKAQAIKKILSG